MPRRRAPWATWYPISGLAGGRCYGVARKQTLHTTQSGGLPNWHSIRSVPHFSVNPATGEAWQHLDLDRSGYALASPGAPNSPNMNAGVVHVQWEVIGYAETVLHMPDAWYRRLAVWMGWVADEWDIPTTFPFRFGGVEAYGPSGAYRVPWDRYRDTSGIVAHQNAPFNAHWDAPFDQERLSRYLNDDKETIVAITDKDVNRIANRVNATLGDFTSDGKPRDPDKRPDGERGDGRLWQIEKVVRRIEKKVDALGEG